MRSNWLIALAVAASLAPACSQADDNFDALRLRWQRQLVRQAPAATAQSQQPATAAGRELARMHGGPDARLLWDDISDFDNPDLLRASAAVTSTAERLLLLARAYGTPGTASYHDAQLGQGIASGLDWLVRLHYRAGAPQIGNWWHWQIGTPLRLLNVMTLADDAVPAALRARCLAAIQWYVPTPYFRTNSDGKPGKTAETGANLLDKALVTILSGMLAKDSERIATGRAAIAPTLDYVTTGDGFYRDGSFIQHSFVPYGGNYGAVALGDYAQLLHLLTGSAWPLPEAQAARIQAYARDSFQSLMVDGKMPDAFRGRKIAERDFSDRTVGRSVAANLALLAELAPPQEAATPVPGAHIFASMDRAILRGPGFAAVLSWTSPRISAFSTGNGENLKGWWTGMGMLALYDADPEQFSHDFWPTVDSMRLPGTTTDHSVIANPQQWTRYPNPEPWVGGAALGKYAALGMAFSLREVTGSPLQGRKAWFLLDDRILALGSGISQGQGKTETIVENRRLSDAAGAQLLVDGAPLPNGSAAQAHWAHLRDDRAGSQTGYVFPQGGPLQAERNQRSGAWRDLHAYGSKEEVRNSYQLLAIPHGQSDYAYLLLPNASVDATRAAARDPGLRIEANDAAAAAVFLPQQGVYAANLWRAGSAPKSGQPYLWSSGPAAVVVEQRGAHLRLAVAEPTQQQAALELTLDQPVQGVAMLSPGVTVLSTSPQLRVRLDTAHLAGATLQAEFSLAAPQP